jgi:uncharacterized protein (UPF0276 family)
MPRLTVSYSDALQALLRAGGPLPIDGVEVGPWFPPRQIVAYRRQCPGCPFHFHAGSLVSRVRYRPRSLRRLERYLACTDNEWLSLHIELLPVALFLIGSRLGLYLSPPGAGQAVQQFVRLLDRIRAAVDMPVILENLPSLSVKEYHYAADPAILADLLERTGCGLLLDLAHARLAAVFQGLGVEDYVRALPLERVQQIHVSGIRLRNGRWYDAHESLEEEDYRLLKWALERCDPAVVTLEYFGQETALREQIERLGEMLGGRDRDAERERTAAPLAKKEEMD